MTPKNTACPLGGICARRQVPGREKYQTYHPFKGGVECEGFIEMKGDK
jgi:hypothetical protein